ncbi:hypothetical protein B0H13DRAFT_2323586 [Mycena leptocephala]|nr:hypothetical protein B0H13DRAFT_2323586 [Mycena leptocephala]
MLQIPSSALSLFSFSSKGLVGILSGLCVGSQVVALVLSSSLKTEFTAVTRTSRTVEIVPTRCVLSNGTLSFPYVAAMGYATLLFAGLVYILRAKGFSCDSSNGHSLPDPPSADNPSSI